jgi:hypothetical protein
MNHNKKIIKHQTNISLNKLKNNNVDFIEKFIFSNKYKSQFSTIGIEYILKKRHYQCLFHKQ